MIIDDNNKNFERPESGMFLGTIIDVVDLGKVTTQFGLKAKVRIVWVLDKNDSEGNPFRVIYQATASVNERAKLFEMVKSILGVAPSVPFDAEVLIGRSNQLYIVRETNAVTKKDFAGVRLSFLCPRCHAAPRSTGLCPLQGQGSSGSNAGSNSSCSVSAAHTSRHRANPCCGSGCADTAARVRCASGCGVLSSITRRALRVRGNLVLHRGDFAASEQAAFFS